MVKQARATGLWLTEIVVPHVCSNLNSLEAPYHKCYHAINRAILTLITATLMRTLTFAKMNSDLIVYGGANLKQESLSPEFHLSIPVTQ